MNRATYYRNFKWIHPECLPENRARALMDSGSDSDFFSDPEYSRRELLTGRWKRRPKHTQSRRCAVMCVTAFVGAVCLAAGLAWQALEGMTQPCEQTKIYPYKSGCPTASRCASLRPDVPSTKEFLRINVGWRLGALYGLHSHAHVFMTSESRLKKRLPGVQPSVLRNFVRLEDELEDLAPALGVEARLQQFLQVELAPLCCVTRNEMSALRSTVGQWTKRHNATKLTVRFDKLRCYHERVNSVNNVLLADKHTTKILAAAEAELRKSLEARGVKIKVEREDQLPFHLNIVEFHAIGRRSIHRYLRELGVGADMVNDGVVTIQLRLGQPFLTDVSVLNNWKYSP